MWPYWLLFLVPAAAALSAVPLHKRRFDGSRKLRVDMLWLMVMLVIALVIGLRDRVGGDWYNYFRYIFGAEHINLAEAMTRSDPAYWALNMVSLDLGLGIIGVNLFCGIVFALGLVVYTRSMPRPWLALAVGIPYMTVVVAMGYSRQGIALGFVLIGLVALGRQRFLWFAFWIFIAATFHRSAVILIGIALLTLDFRKIYNLPLLAVIGMLLYSAFLEDAAEGFISSYIEAEMQSSGAFIRLLMNVIPGILFLYYRRRLLISPGESKIYSVMALLAIASFTALLVGAVPSTALDRMGLYLIPLQIFLFSHLPDGMGRRGGVNQGLVSLILLFYAATLFAWLNFATHAHFWLPYRMFPPIDIIEASQQGRRD